jgi:putative transport protein
MEWLLHVLKTHPEVAFFLVLGIGYALGKLSLGGFSLGAVTGTLLAGVLVGQFGIKISGDVKQCFFLLFLFSIGFRTGPQFFRGLKSDGLQQAAVAAIVATVGLIIAVLVSKFMHYDAGTGAGLVAGALTESATIGTASDAISRLPLDEAARHTLTNNIPVAFAVTYLVGVIGAAWFLSQMGPKLMGVDLAAECRKLEDSMRGGEGKSGTARQEFEFRTYCLEANSPFIGKRVDEVEESGNLSRRISIEGLRHEGKLVHPEQETKLSLGDTISVSGRREILMQRLEAPGVGLQECDDRELLDVQAESVDVVVTSAALDGKTLVELSHEPIAHGLFVKRITRGGTPVAWLPNTPIHRGDVVTLVGPSSRIAAAAKGVGFIDRATDVSDMVLVAFGIVAGALIGIPALNFSGLEIGLSMSVGVLLGGLVCGWLRSRQPRLFGRIPTPTLWIFESIGLTGFVAIVGLNAGPDFVKGLQASGLSLVLAGVVTVIVPHLVGVLVGHHLFKMHPGILLGVCAGAGTATPALAAIQEKAKSAVPTLGYGVSYAVGNVLLALWGTVMVAILK